VSQKADAAAALVGAGARRKAMREGLVTGAKVYGHEQLTPKGLQFALLHLAEVLVHTKAASLAGPLGVAADFVGRNKKAPDFSVSSLAAPSQAEPPIAGTWLELAARVALGQIPGATVRVRCATKAESATFQGVGADSLRIQVMADGPDTECEPFWASAQEWAAALQQAMKGSSHAAPKEVTPAAPAPVQRVGRKPGQTARARGAAASARN